jgi:hypothetical protein
VQSKEKLVSSLCKLDECGLHSLIISYGEETFLPALGCIREVIGYITDVFQNSRWIESLPNLHRLSSNIDQQDVKMFGLIPNLLELSLYVNSYRQLIIRCEGFQQLQSFEVSHTRVVALMFEPGAMPRLKKLKLHIFLAEQESAAVDFDFGIRHLSSLAQLDVILECTGSTAAEVKAAEDAFKSMAEAHPNRPALEMTREIQPYIQDKTSK